MHRIASTVGSEMAKLVLPIEMLTFPQEDFEDMMDTTMIALYLFGTPAEPAVDSNHRTLGLLVGQENVGLRVDLSYRQCHVSTGRDTRGSSDRVLG